MKKNRNGIDYKKREKIFNRDNHECQAKGNYCTLNKNLQIHHIDKNYNNNEYKNLMVVCSACHIPLFHNKKLDLENKRSIKIIIQKFRKRINKLS